MDIAGDPNPIIRVQTLAQTHLTGVPPQYIQPPHNRPSNNLPPIRIHSSNNNTGNPNKNHPFSSSLPLIDLHSTSFLLRGIARACSEWGAFHIINHGVPTQLLSSIKASTLSFFNDCPISCKTKYACDSNSPASEGYGTRMLLNNDDDGDLGFVLDWRDYFDHHTLPISRRDPSRWPHFPPNYRGLMEEYSDHMKGLAQRLLGFVSESLDLPSHCIENAVGGEFYQNVTVSYYPPCPQPELTLGLQPHSDMGAITLLIQDDVGGLEVFKDGDWVMVQPVSDAIVVLLADQAEIITNGVYKSAQHRAITNCSRARLSIATFHDPAKTVKICPVPELARKHSGPRYRPVVYGEYVSSWYSKGPEGKRNLDALAL